MSRTVEVNTGEVQIGQVGTILRSSAIGSCVVVAAFDPVERIGGLAHIMVPGKASNEYDTKRTRYAEDGIEKLMELMMDAGCKKRDIIACLVGGANVLKRNNDRIGEDNIISIIGILTRKDIPIIAHSLGGIERRSIIISVSNAKVQITIGNSSNILLFDFDSPDKTGGSRNEWY